ncbi:MAG: hypothetical protein LBB88_10115 [Planctomycetaceae bacterium]|nr:hypothetical protein [Planctomycetaceae bacterium]
MVCSNCKKNITVSPSNSPSAQSTRSTPPTPPSPPTLSTSPAFDYLNLTSELSLEDLETDINSNEINSSIDSPESSTSIITNDAETALLAAVFTGKIQDKKEADIRAKIPPPAPKKIQNITPKKKLVSRELIIFVTIILLLAGITVYFTLFFDWLGKDERVELLQKLENYRIKTTIAIGNKDSEIESLRVKSINSWTSTGDAIDAFIMTIGDIDTKNRDVLELDWNLALNTINESGKQQLIAIRDEIKNSIPAAETNLSKLKSQTNQDAKNAEKNESEIDTAINDTNNLRAELQFIETEIDKLKQQIKNSPDDRPTATFPIFDKKNIPPKNTAASLDNDWTEEYYNQFTFAESHEGNYFTTLDAMRRLYGNRSLRITLIEREPISILFPSSNQTNNNLQLARTFKFAIRFPDLTDAIMIGEEKYAGQFNEIKIKFSNESGHVEFITKSRDYCDAVFYSGRGKFVVIEFSLEGDEFWKRIDNFNNSKLTKIIEQQNKRELTDDEIKAMTDESKSSELDREKKALEFFTQINNIEFKLTPTSKRTTFWLDGICIADNSIRSKLELVRAIATKKELQILEHENRKKRRQRSVFHSLSQIKGFQNWQPPEQPEIDPTSTDPNNDKIKYESENNSTNSTNKTNTKPPTESDKTEKKPDAETNNKILQKGKSAFFKWIINDVGGRIKASSEGRVFTFWKGTKIPDDVENYIIEQVSIANYSISTAQLDRIAELKTLKKLDLENVGLKNSDMIKLSVLDSLEILNLSNNQLTYEALPAIKTLRKLQDLNLSGIKMSVNGIDSLGSFRSLVSLNLNAADFDSADLNYCITLANLEILNLSGTKVGDRVTGIMQVLTNLKEIDLSKTRISNKAIDSLITLNNLEIIKLDSTSLDENCLESLGKIKNLKSVSIKNTKISQENIRKKLPNTKIKFEF